MMIGNIGLDFGTTTSVLSYMEDGKLKYFKYGGETEGGTPYIPSVIAYDERELYIGRDALSFKQITDDIDLFRYFKMLLPESEPGNWPAKYGPYRENEVSPTEITADYISELITGCSPYREDRGIKKKNKFSFQEFYGLDELPGLVVSVPQVWKDVRARGINQLKKAIESSGLNLIQLVREPVAAAAFYTYRYRQRQESRFKGNLLVCDMGGGTFDVTLCRIDDTKIEVLFNLGDGDSGIGRAGVKFDYNLIEEVEGVSAEELDDKELFELLTGLDDQKKNRRMINKILENQILDPDKGRVIYKLYSETLDRQLRIKYEKVLKAFEGIEQGINSVLSRVEERLEENNYSLDKIILVGGFAKFPLVQQAVASHFGEDLFLTGGRKIDIQTLNPDQMAFAISFGATLIANDMVDVYEKYEHTIGVFVGKGRKFDIERDLIKAGENLQKLADINYCNNEKGKKRIFRVNPRKDYLNLKLYYYPFNRQEEEIVKKIQLKNRFDSSRVMLGGRVDRSKNPYLIIRDAESDEVAEFPLDQIPDLWEISE